MTREELKEHCERQIQQFERVKKIMPVTLNDWKRYEEHKLILELLEQEPCEDCISREWLKTAIHNFYQGLIHTPTEEDIQAYIDVAPSVNPQKPKILNRDEVARRLGTVDVYTARAWISLLKDLEFLGLGICEVKE